MGKIVISENVTLDGVVQDPTGEEGFTHGGWFSETVSKDSDAWAKVLVGEARAAEALLLGRRTDEYFAERWLGRSGELAERLNSLPKYVVSSTLEEPKWSNSTGFKGRVLRGNPVTEVSNLKQELEGDIVIYASNQLVHTLMEHDLVDELRLLVFPFVLGAGERLFNETSDRKPMRLRQVQTVGDNLALLTYERVRSV